MLLSLPPELHLLIISNLSFPDLTCLKVTCSYFYHLIPPMSHEELLEAECTAFAIDKDLYACRYCLRLRSGGRFADRMLRRRRGRRGRHAGRRFCVQCGLKPRGDSGEARYGPGAQVVMMGTAYVLCAECRRLGVAGMQRVGAMQPGALSHLCEQCWGKNRE
ncbi:F-box domain protein [Aspergillus lucknowensis]|uniref:F-box domain-containing protein n=1 Tax=Aspergillus lucknowensis TaxID=176173 RepID=A0ABR4LXI7_9EURO